MEKAYNEYPYFMKSLGFPSLEVYQSFKHFDFSKPSRRILVIGPMGSGKTEYSARIWRDSLVAQKKGDSVKAVTMSGLADRRNVFVVRSILDRARFSDFPEDALAYRGGFERCGNRIAYIRNSFDLEVLIQNNPECGTWIIDEASFFDERIVYIMNAASMASGLVFLFPTLILNFRKEIFNNTARFLLDHSTDVYPLTAYCEHKDCLTASYYTYRYYKIEGEECPALYFDPLIIIGGDIEKEDPHEPNYCTRCDEHHYLPGKEYTFLILKPLAEKATAGHPEFLKEELGLINSQIEKSLLFDHFSKKYIGNDRLIYMNSLKVPCIAERALIFLFAEQNLIGEELFISLVYLLKLDKTYIQQRLSDNRRIISSDFFEEDDKQAILDF